MSGQRSAAEQLDLLIDAYLADLIDISPEELADEPGDHAADQEIFEDILAKAKTEAGRRRLLRSKQELEKKWAQAKEAGGEEQVDIEVARKYIAAAANDKQFTLAARDLRELPDEEIIRIYSQLKYLERGNSQDQ